MKRPPETLCIPAAVIATIAGVRAPTCMIPVIRPIEVVRPAMKASGVIASAPHASALMTEATPSRSASAAKVAAPSQSPG